MNAETKSLDLHHTTTFSIILAVGFCHLLNDLMQAILPAIYPLLKENYHLSFAQIGLITLAFQFTASLLQPAVGFMGDRRAMPFSLPAGMTCTMVGLILISMADSYPTILVSAAIVGIGSSFFHPESSRVARMAAGTRHGLAQSIFQVGGNIGSAFGPLMAALVVGAYGQKSIFWSASLALLAIFILFNVGLWYRKHGLERIKAAHASHISHGLPRGKIFGIVAILLALIFVQMFYSASISSYFTFYLIEKFHVSVQSAQLHLFAYLFAIALGTLLGGFFGDRIGRKRVILFAILGPLPFALAMPYAGLLWTGVFIMLVGVIMASAFPTIVVYGQDLIPGKTGTISGMFFGFSFGIGGIGAALLGKLADMTSIDFVYHVVSFLPLLGLLAFLLPDVGRRAKV